MTTGEIAGRLVHLCHNGQIEEAREELFSDAIVSRDYFALTWKTDIQMKDKERKMNSELSIYKVQDGKIISEQFFY